MTVPARPVSRPERYTDVEARSRTLVQSPLRAGILRFLSARPDESFDVEALMTTFGRLRLDVENCVRELVDFGVAVKSDIREPALYAGILALLLGWRAWKWWSRVRTTRRTGAAR